MGKQVVVVTENTVRGRALARFLDLPSSALVISDSSELAVERIRGIHDAIFYVEGRESLSQPMQEAIQLHHFTGSFLLDVHQTPSREQRAEAIASRA